MDNQRGIPDDYQQQMAKLDRENKPLVMIIDGVKTIAMKRGKPPKESYKPYVEVAERLRILHERIKNKEIESYDMLVSEPGEIQDRVWWQVRICIDKRLFIGSSEVHLKGAAFGSADEKDAFANAETSALGRALGAAGLGTIDGLASYDEMRQAGFSSNPPQSQVVEESDPDIKRLKDRFEALSGKRDLTPVKKHLRITHNGAVILDKHLTVEHKAAIDKYLTSKEAGGSNG